MVEQVHDVVIIGAGIMGSCTAYHAAMRGLNPLVLEQFNSTHRQGASHGKSRMFRFLYPELAYLEIAMAAKKLWEQLQDDTGTTLFKNSEYVLISNRKKVVKTSMNLSECDLKHEVLESGEINRKYPMLKYTLDWFALIDYAGGLLYANECLDAARTEAVKHGATFKFMERVVGVISKADHVLVNTTRGQYLTKKLVVTAGAWINQILPELNDIVDIQSVQVPRLYWNVDPEHSQQFKHGPVVEVDRYTNVFCMIPPVDHQNQVKVSVNIGAPHDPDHPLETHHNMEMLIDCVADHIREHMPHVDHSHPANIEMSTETVTDNGNFIVGRFPDDDRISLACGFKGNGYNFAIVVGQMLADLVEDADEEDVVPEEFSLEAHMDQFYWNFRQQA